MAGIGFVEFQDAYTAGLARGSLQGFAVTPEFHMRVAYAKK
jgi:hypothetical protein